MLARNRDFCRKRLRPGADHGSRFHQFRRALLVTNRKWSGWYARGEGVRLKRRNALLLAGGAFTFLCTAYALDRTLPKPFRELPGVEYRIGTIPLPPDYQAKTEWAFARLMFPPGWNNGYEGRDNPAWWEGT